MSKRIVVVTGLVASTLLLGPVARAQNPAPAPTEQPPAPVANGHASIMGQSIESSSGISPGAHARIAFNIGGLSGNGPRRSGFAIGADAHPLFTGAGKGLSLTAGLGGEWY
jgi:hypothetical protein